MSKAHWTESAITDLEAIEAYLKEYSSAIAAHEVGLLIRAARWLADTPFAGPALDVEDWRKWKPRGIRHLLVYRRVATGIDVLRVHHEATDWHPPE